MNTHARTVLAGILVSLLAAAGCARGADEDVLRVDLQAKLDREVKPGLFKVEALRREGSGPLPAGDSGARRVIVYFNTTLKVAEDYSFGGWNQLGPSSVAYALGATDKGLFGLKAESRAGDVVRAYGSAIYEQGSDGWHPVAALPTQATTAPDIEGTALPPRSKQLIDKLATMVNLPPPGVPPGQEEIIADELARASENIERRVKRRQHTFTLASGPEDSEYARFSTAMIAAVNEVAPAVKLRQRFSGGSVDNAWLLSRGEADYAIVQADVAAAAIAGQGAFARGGPLDNLRAVGGLFPEAVHVVVLASSPITEIDQLRGKRVEVGAPSSGTRFDAEALLDAYGLKVGDLSEAGESSIAAALDRLQRKRVDAVFLTASAPTRPLQELAVKASLRLLPVRGIALQRLVRSRPGLTALTLPPNAYPRQKEAITTVASAALLLTTADAPRAEVERVTDLVFTRMPQLRAGSADVVKVSAEHERHDVTVQLHPGAERQDK